MRGAVGPDMDRALEHRLQEIAARQPSLSAEEFGSLARSVSSGGFERARGRSRRRSRHRVVVFATLVVVAAMSAPLLAGMLDRLAEIAQQTGIEEQTPASPPPGYQPAEEPYVSVRPLMRYAGSDVPVVPRSAVTERRGREAVFIIDVAASQDGSDGTVAVRLQPVSLGRTYGKAVSIDAGLTPCAAVVVKPSRELRDGDRIRYYQGEGPTIDYSNLFEGRPEAAPPPIEGGIAYEDDGAVILTIYHNEDPPPHGSWYEFSSKDGVAKRVPYGDPAEVRVPRESLEPGAPLGFVKLTAPSGEVLAQGPLDWYCAPYAAR